MFGIMVLHSFLLVTGCYTPTNSSFLRTSISGNQLPYNTTLPQSGNPLYLPCLLTQNIPWFFPLITFVFMLMGDYIMGIKKGVDTKLNFVAVAIAFTVLTYVEVVSSLTNVSYFFTFEFIMLISLFLMSLFGANKPQSG